MEKINSDLFKKFENDVVFNMTNIRGGVGVPIDTPAGTWCDGWCWESDVEQSDCGCTAYYGVHQCPPCAKSGFDM